MTEQQIADILQYEARNAEQQLILAIKQSKLFNNCYSYKSRPKDDIIEKVTRKRKKEPDYNIPKVTDIVGIRFITLFRIEMAEVYDTLTDIIQGTNCMNPNLFAKDSIEEIKFYHTSKYDRILNRVCEITKAKNISVNVEPIINEREYSSIHIVARLNWTTQELEKVIPSYRIPIEIQIRTSFEDTWGEIDHKYKYDIDKKDNLSMDPKTYSRLEKHLIVLKKFSDSCAEYADAIYYDVHQESLDCVDDQPVFSVDTDNETLDKFKEIGVPDKIIEVYKEARAIRVTAEAEENEKKEFGRKNYLLAREVFKELVKDITAEDLADKSNFILYYYAKMNEAVCLLSTNQTEHVEEALEIYNDLTNNYYNFPLLKMRTGQAYGKLNFTEIGLEWLNKSYAEIKAFEKDGNAYTEELPEVDYKHIKTYLPKLLGYNLWKKSIKIKSDTANIKEKIKLIVHAHNITQEMMIYDLEKDKNLHIDKHNNLLYYSLLIVNTCRENNLTLKGSKIEEEIPFHIDRLENLVELSTTNDIDTLDTLLKAYSHIGETDKINNVVERIIPLAEELRELSSCDVEVMDEIKNYAVELRGSIA